MKPETFNLANELLLSAKSVRLILKKAKKQKFEKGENETINYYLE